LSVSSRLHLPVQRDGRAELHALASEISVVVVSRQRRRGGRHAHGVPKRTTDSLEARLDELAAAAAAAAAGERRRQRVTPIALTVAAVSVGTLVLSVHHASTPRPAPAPHPVVQPVTAPAGTAAAWGQAAHVRLAQGGRPVTVFGCEGAYIDDAQRSVGALPTPGPGTVTFQQYLAACVSDMSGR
jgi:hypothetical protein